MLIVFCLIGVIVWQNCEHRKQIDELTSKIVAKSLGEYTANKQDSKITVTIPPKKEKKIIDPVMGEVGKNW